MNKPRKYLVALFVLLDPLSVSAEDGQLEVGNRPTLSDLVEEWAAGLRPSLGDISGWQGGGCGTDKNRPCYWPGEIPTPPPSRESVSLRTGAKTSD